MSEQELAKKDGAKLQPNSGRGMRKGDAILEPFLLDYKEYTTSFSVSETAWNKHKKDSWNEHQRFPAFGLVLNKDTRLAIIDWDMFMEMRQAWIEKNKEAL